VKDDSNQCTACPLTSMQLLQCLGYFGHHSSASNTVVKCFDPLPLKQLGLVGPNPLGGIDCCPSQFLSQSRFFPALRRPRILQRPLGHQVNKIEILAQRDRPGGSCF
jgi:hypothetical protein